MMWPLLGLLFLLAGVYVLAGFQSKGPLARWLGEIAEGETVAKTPQSPSAVEPEVVADDEDPLAPYASDGSSMELNFVPDPASADAVEEELDFTLDDKIAVALQSGGVYYRVWVAKDPATNELVSPFNSQWKFNSFADLIRSMKSSLKSAPTLMKSLLDCGGAKEILESEYFQLLKSNNRQSLSAKPTTLKGKRGKP